jgi:hypothetical protein
MPHFECLACKTRLHGTDGEADPIGDLCPVWGSLLEPVGDLGEIVGYRVIESRGGTLHHGPSVAGQLIVDRVGEIIVRRELEHARVRLEIESCDAHPVNPQVQAVSSRAPGTGDEAVRRRRTPTTAARPRGLGAFDDGRHRRERARRKFALRPGPSFGWRIREMGLTPSHEDDDTLRAWRRGNVTVDWSASYAAAWARLSRAG